MLKRLVLVGCLIVAAISTAAVWIWAPWLLSPNYTIHLATAPLGADGQKFYTALKKAVADEHPRVRLALVEAASLKESGDSLQSGKFDLAVARSDHPAAASGGTIVILRRIALVVMSAPNSKVTTMKDLVGRKIAIPDNLQLDDPLLMTVMEFYGLKAGDFVSAGVGSVGEMLRDKKVAAVIAMGPAGPGILADTVRAVVKDTHKPPQFIDLEESTAIAAQHPVYEEIEIPRGTFIAAPPLPSDDVTTVGLTVRLVAKNSMLNEVAGEMTRLLLVTKAKLAASLPRVAQIEAPNTDNSDVLPVHPGTVAFLDGETPSMFERASDLLFDLSIIGGLFGSLAVGVGSYWRRHRPDETHKLLSRLPVLLRNAKSAPVEGLDAIESELDAISAHVLERFIAEEIASEKIHAVAVLIAQIQQTMARRRQAG